MFAVSCAAPHAHLPSLLFTLSCALGSSVRWSLRKVSPFRDKAQSALVNTNSVQAEDQSRLFHVTFPADTCQVALIALIGCRGLNRLSSSVSIFVNQLQKREVRDFFRCCYSGLIIPSLNYIFFNLKVHYHDTKG